MDAFAFGDPFATIGGGQTGTDNRKRPREEEEDDYIQEGREISRTITHDNDEDADFVSSLLGCDETPNKMQYQGGRCDFGRASSWQQMFAATGASMQQQIAYDSRMPALDTLSYSGDAQFFPQQPLAAAQPIDDNNKGPTMFVERWTCDICKTMSFETFEEANRHEAQCKQSIQDAAKRKEEEQKFKTLMRDAAGTLTSLALCPPPTNYQATTVNTSEQENGNGNPVQQPLPPVAATATRHPMINLVPQGNDQTLSDYNNLLVRNVEFFYPGTDNRVGLRCIHCKNHPHHVSAATFFPSTMSSISSGLGTIGARHFGWGKCPYAPSSLLAEMATTKKTTHLQTRTKGRVGLDAYCKNVAKQYGIIDDETSGISWIEGTPVNLDLVDETYQRKMTNGRKRGKTKDANPEPDSNAMASVLANMKNDDNEWETSKKTVTTKRLSSGRRAAKANKNKTGVEDVALCFQDDQQYTTDYAYFIIQNTKKCYLTKGGGSRSSCPVGFAGLVCSHCAGTPEERRFFSSSADHLRNSFSHIPSHMEECIHCPADVKARLAELKTTRNKQKTQLKAGYHKIFIDRLWERLHGPALTSDDEDEEKDIDKDDDNTKAVARRPNMKAASTSLVLETDRASTSDLMYFTLLQLEPYKPDGADSREIDLPGVVCRHCMNTPNGSKFFTTSSEHLGDLLVTISDHMSTSCEQCPNKVKAEMATHQASHEMQLATLPEGDHGLCMKRVWNRLEDVNSEAKQPEEPRAPIQYGAVDGNMSLVSPSQESLVTPFTYYTFQQCRPCNLDNTKNGSRSNFDNGFPGIECLHCAGRPNTRRFFYRTAEILSGNYSHIPNHIMTCSGCPPEVKEHMKELKASHAKLKNALPKGSQKEFFNAVWDRLHSVAIPAAAASSTFASVTAVPPPLPALPSLPALPPLEEIGQNYNDYLL